METIEENSKSDISTISTSAKKIRICLVGEVIKNIDCVQFAQTLGIPVFISETGVELCDDLEWQTFFILEDFESSTFEAIYAKRNKHCIMSPIALKGGLKRYTRPVYNFSMRGVVACFKGLRDKDFLRRMVLLMHSMGGSMRRGVNLNVTHLICTEAGGDKYHYAKTFRLIVVRPDWVFAAWERRHEIDFYATADDFTKEHSIKAFEGLKICFRGFPPDEHAHMVDVLKSNGGIPVDIDDPECTHVVVPADYHGDILKLSTTNINISRNPNVDSIVESNDNNNDIKMNSLLKISLKNNQIEIDNDFMETDNVKNTNDEVETTDNPINNDINTKYNNDQDKNDQDKNDEDNNDQDKNDQDKNDEDNNASPSVKRYDDNALVIDSSTPILAKIDDSENFVKTFEEECKEADAIWKGACNMPVTFGSMTESPIDIANTPHTVTNIGSKEIEMNFDRLKDMKRKHESFDTCSLMSIDSNILSTSTKKPKLSRGSITRSIKRSMAFMADHTPLSRVVTRRTSLDVDVGTPLRANNFDESLCSMNSMQTTMNESKRTQFKDTMRSFREHLTSSNNRKNVQSPHELGTEQEEEFKTPKGPFKSLIGRTLSATKKTLSTSKFHLRRQSWDICGQSSHTPIIDDNFTFTKNCTTTTVTTTSTVTSTTNQPPAILNQDQKRSSHPVSSDETLKNELNSKGHSNTVVDEHASPVKPVLKNLRMPIVKSDWFWYTIQNGYANEMDYLFTDFSDSITDTPNRDRRESLPISLNKRKRKRFSQRLQLEGTPFDSGKRRSSNSDGGLLSASGSFFDCTTTPDKLEPVESDALTCKQKSMRFNHFMDFYITESNYVGILDTIVNLFQKPLEEMADKNDALLSKSEIKEIFGNFLPIHVVHKDILQKLRVLHGEWSDDCLIGDIILQHRDDLITAYPPYVNYFEQMKDKLLQCDAQKPRFHAFLKINQTKPECGRQRLQDLMIRPVQRLPSTIILLKGILKYTSKDNPDYHPLEEALKAMNEVTTYIDEDKRKSNSRMAIFDIFKDIENCPAHLVSSNRDFISRCDVNELSDSLSGRGDALILYLFTDTLEVCKKRSRTFNSTKSPSSTKSYKHINLISLNAIRFVIDITDSPRAFAILCRQDNDELYAFSLIEGTDKMKYLKILCKQMAENACRTDPNKSLLYRTSQELEVDISNVNTSTLSKAIKLARTRFKVGRAFSFNKTPSKLKRAVSTMMTSPFGSTNSLTPASQLSQMRLASCTNINEVAQEDNCDDVQNKSPSKESEQ